MRKAGRACLGGLLACTVACGGKTVAVSSDGERASVDATAEAQDTGDRVSKDDAATGFFADALTKVAVDATTDASVDVAMDEGEMGGQLDAADAFANCEPPNPFGTYPNCVCCPF